MTRQFGIKEEYIELIRLLKVLRISESGGHAKMLVEDGLVKVNGQTEYRKRAKLRPGTLVTVFNETIEITRATFS